MQQTKEGKWVFSKGEPLVRMFTTKVAASPGLCVKIDTAVAAGTQVDLAGAEADQTIIGVITTLDDNTISYAAGAEVPVVLEGPALVLTGDAATNNIAAGNAISSYSTSGDSQLHSNALSCAFAVATEACSTDGVLTKVYIRKTMY